MRKWLDELASVLHRNYLKPIGFKKNARTFTRDQGEYLERINLQSGWSAPGMKKWTYYVNVGVVFKGIPLAGMSFGQPNVHWSQRIETIVGGAYKIRRYSEEKDTDREATELAGYVIAASENVQKEIVNIRKLVVHRKKPWAEYQFPR
ncbi:MAG: DUF4304 domain-containing protein [Pyrinomonadaceae bacterium]|nr:DUF4304 domain-containing protein [Blastocatellia bacterium]MCW5955690.1 DUF4304 domain-containing protein [Pyrinomonadaceae bacterium]